MFTDVVRGVMSNISCPIRTLDATELFGLFLLAAILLYLMPYCLDPLGLRAYPGPFLAKFSNVWMVWIAICGRWSYTVEKLRTEYGPFVRLSPTHISIADAGALDAIYGHASNTTKSGFYDAFTGDLRARSVLTSRNREEHARKRRVEAHLFAPQSVRALEDVSKPHLAMLMTQWDRLCAFVQNSEEGGPRVGRTPRDIEFTGLNFWSFDNIGDLALGRPFGVLDGARDTLQVAKCLEDAYAAITHIRNNQTSSSSELSFETTSVPVIATMTTSGKMLSCLGWVPTYWQSLASRLPMFRRGAHARNLLNTFAAGAVTQRLANPGGREDMLQRLIDGRDEAGRPMGAQELTAEALALIIAGSDTTSTTACVILYYLARDRGSQAKLQAELDAALSAVSSEDAVASFSSIESLPYLSAVINESLRVHSTVGAGLPRLVPAGGISVLGREFKEGTSMSVPTYTLHRKEEYWGVDAQEFRPERWLEIGAGKQQGRGQVHGQGLGGNLRGTTGPFEAFVPFSIGPRACIGRNLALMMLHVVVATLVRRYDFVLESPDTPLKVNDGFLRKPYGCMVGVKRRGA